MEDTGLGRELDQLEADYTLRLNHLSVEAVSVLREIMSDERERSELRATIARVVLDMTYREEIRKTKNAAKG